ncbi:MAG: glycosyltransferase family 2 protein [Terriglobales bacterium]
MNKPLISVVMLSYRRRNELTKGLESVRRQTYEPKEILVVDNNSGDGTPAFLAQEFPDVQVLGMSENLGCGGRNRGVEKARGEFVVTLDNDVRFESPDELEKIALAFAERPQAAVLVFKVLRENTGRLLLRDWCHPRSYAEYADREFETWFIAEGACAFRRQDFLGAGGYYEPFFIGGEGWDLALRLVDRDRTILYRPEIHVQHAMAAETRSGRRPYYFMTRNYIWTAFKDYSGWRRWQYILYGMCVTGFFSLRTGSLNEMIRGFRDGWKGRAHLPRTPVSERGWQRMRVLGAQRASWWRRFRTHWSQSEI